MDRDIYNNYGRIINELAFKKELTPVEKDRLSKALTIEKLVYDSQYGDD